MCHNEVMEKIKARDLQRGDKITLAGDTVKVLNLCFYGNRVQIEIEWPDKSSCQISKKTSQNVEKVV